MHCLLLCSSKASSKSKIMAPLLAFWPLGTQPQWFPSPGGFFSIQFLLIRGGVPRNQKLSSLLPASLLVHLTSLLVLQCQSIPLTGNQGFFVWALTPYSGSSSALAILPPPPQPRFTEAWICFWDDLCSCLILSGLHAQGTSPGQQYLLLVRAQDCPLLLLTCHS